MSEKHGFYAIKQEILCFTKSPAFLFLRYLVFSFCLESFFFSCLFIKDFSCFFTQFFFYKPCGFLCFWLMQLFILFSLNFSFVSLIRNPLIFLIFCFTSSDTLLFWILLDQILYLINLSRQLINLSVLRSFSLYSGMIQKSFLWNTDHY